MRKNNDDKVLFNSYKFWTSKLPKDLKILQRLVEKPEIPQKTEHTEKID